MHQLVSKPWGDEVIITESNLPYSGKIIHTKAGHRWSLQYHDQKIETITLISGRAQLILDDQTIDMVINTGYTINPLSKHRLIAVTDTTTFEVSTPETGTTFRLEDDYQRPNETPDVRSLTNRGWQN